MARPAPAPMSGPIEPLDARRLLCPLPVLRTQARVAGLAPGAVLEVWCTDPAVLQDIPAWCRIHGHEYLGAARDGREIRLQLRVLTGANAPRKAASAAQP